jgi:hypothetical protein
VRRDHTKIVNTAELVSGLQVLKSCRPVPGTSQAKHLTASALPRAGAVSLAAEHDRKGVQRTNEGSPARWQLMIKDKPAD